MSSDRSDVAAALLSQIANVAKELHPALGVLKGIYDIYQGVQQDKKRCAGLVDRASRVLDSINNEVTTKKTRPKPDNVKRLTETLVYIRDVVENYGDLSFLSSLKRKEEIKLAIEQGYYRLEDCLQLFQIKTLQRIEDIQSEMRREDKERHDELVQILERIEVCVRRQEPAGHDVFSVDGQPEDEVMLTMHREIERLDDETSLEKKILQLGLQSLEEHGGKMAPEWTITSFDLSLHSGPEARIGAGGFSQVVRGRWKGTDVAIKYVYGDVKSFTQEIDVWRKLSHDHIVPFYGASLSAETPYIVSRYMKNGNMVSYLRRNPTKNRVKIIHEVSLGLLYLHGASIVHGDIKGENVLIDDSGKACITDFGLSKVKTEDNTLLYMSNSPTRTPKIAGTLRFMAPEALREGRQNYKTDVFSFGMLIYQAFTLEAPFADVSDKDLRSGRVRSLKKPKGEARGLTDDLWGLHQSCTAGDPDSRPSFKRITLIMEPLSNSWNQIGKKHHPAGPGLDPPRLETSEDDTKIAFLQVPPNQIPASRSQETLIAKQSSWFNGTSKTLIPSSLSFSQKRAFCIEFTMCEYHATMILEGAKPHVKAFGRLYPNHPGKKSFKDQDSHNSFVSWYSRDVTEIWKIDGRKITRDGPQIMSFEFSGDSVARLWFDTLLLYSKGKEPQGSGCYPAFVNWKTEGVGWRRTAKQSVQAAPINSEHPTSPPPSSTWTTLPRPLSCSELSVGAKMISFRAEFKNQRSPYWTYTLEGRTVRKESRERPEQDVLYSTEERCDTHDEAESWFQELKDVVQSWQD